MRHHDATYKQTLLGKPAQIHQIYNNNILMFHCIECSPYCLYHERGLCILWCPWFGSAVHTTGQSSHLLSHSRHFSFILNEEAMGALQKKADFIKSTSTYKVHRFGIEHYYHFSSDPHSGDYWCYIPNPTIGSLPPCKRFIPPPVRDTTHQTGYLWTTYLHSRAYELQTAATNKFMHGQNWEVGSSSNSSWSSIVRDLLHRNSDHTN